MQSAIRLPPFSRRHLFGLLVRVGVGLAVVVAVAVWLGLVGSFILDGWLVVVWVAVAVAGR
jgi:hypothetical protein